MLQTEWRPESLAIAQELKRHAEARGQTPGQFAVNWLLNNRLVTAVIAGPRTEAQWDEADEFFKSSYHAMPVGALLPEDIAGAVVFLASPEARYITGVTIDVAAGANARYTA